MTTRPSSSSFAYARALLELADERGVVDAVSADVAGIAAVLEDVPTLASYLRDPGVKQEDRTKLLNTSFGGRISPLTQHFLHMLTGKAALDRLPEIVRAYRILLDERAGRVEVSVTVAQALSGPDFEDVRRRISASLGGEAIVEQKVDPEILGGIVIRVGDRVIDGSVATQLDAMRRQLSQARAAT